jgi:hypothetical protein
VHPIAMMKTHLLLSLSVTLFSMPACDHARRSHGGADAPIAVHEQPMAEAAIVVPIREGKTEAWQAALEDLLGPRYEEYKTSRERYGVTSQTTFLQRTPMGDLAVIHLTGPDVHASFHAMSTSQDPWDVSWREMTMDLHGVDFAKGEKVMPKVEPLFSMDAVPLAGSKPFAFVAPLTADKLPELRALAAELNGPRHDEYVKARQRAGVQREAVFLQQTPMGLAVVFYWLAPDPVATLKSLADSTDPFDRYVMSTAATLHPVGLDTLTATVAQNKLIAQYPHP